MPTPWQLSCQPSERNQIWPPRANAEKSHVQAAPADTLCQPAAPGCAIRVMTHCSIAPRPAHTARPGTQRSPRRCRREPRVSPHLDIQAPPGAQGPAGDTRRRRARAVSMGTLGQQHQAQLAGSQHRLCDALSMHDDARTLVPLVQTMRPLRPWSRKPDSFETSALSVDPESFECHAWWPCRRAHMKSSRIAKSAASISNDD